MNDAITQALSGRQVEYVIRDDDGGITIVCDHGREVSLFVDSNTSIQLRCINARVVITNPIQYTL